MKWLALVLVVTSVVLGPRLVADPPRDCVGGTTPGGLYEESNPGEDTADEAVADFLERSDHHTVESSDDGLAVTYRTFDADDRPLNIVTAEHRLPRGWYVGRTTTC